MRLSFIFSFTFLIVLLVYTHSVAYSSSIDTQSIIIEVEGDPINHESYFKTYHPYIEVIAIYDILFNGLALKVPTNRLSDLEQIDFVKVIHSVQNYEASERSFNQEDYPEATLPADLNTTKYTGKGVKIAVIDTGIDYNHPDLALNYQGGYDLVDLDDDPMETTASEGIPTIHGTHVAGIIAANGKLTGVAPDSDIYAYRALGSGGRGTTVQIIAAMEQAINDGVDIMNLSLGNTVNGPDYPTSIAVNRAIDLGVAVVIANGNNGPDNWTVGSPATASKAFSVGASAPALKVPELFEAKENKRIPFSVMNGSIPWRLTKDYQIVTQTEGSVFGKILLLKRGTTSFYEKAKEAEKDGAAAVLIYNNVQGNLYGSIENGTDKLTIPVAGLNQSLGKWLLKRAESELLYINTVYHELEESIAPFSSRGPVTINWQIKPDILAPGTEILSTTPANTYQTLQGTSMAAPHVAGAIAVMKEAKPNWTNDQIIGALKTTALQMKDNHGQPRDPVEQGAGEIQLDQAIETETIITDSLLTFEKVTKYKETKKVLIHIENLSNEAKTFYFDIPKQQTGLTWNLPQTFTVGKGEVKKVPIELNVTTQQLEEAIHQGWITLNQGHQMYHLPYLFINKTADYPLVNGFQFSLKVFSQDVYIYRIYLADEVKNVDVHLYHPDTLIYEGKLLSLKNIEIGMNEGEVKKSKIKQRGLYKALIRVELANGMYETHETEIFIE